MSRPFSALLALAFLALLVVAVTAGGVTSDTTTRTSHGTYQRAIRYEWSGAYGGVQHQHTATVPGFLVAWSGQHDCNVHSAQASHSVVHISCKSADGFDGSWGVIRLEYSA